MKLAASSFKQKQSISGRFCHKSPLLAFFISITLLQFTLPLSSCSLKYGTEENIQESTPEFTFSDAVFSRYEGNKIQMQLKTELLEQYKKDSNAYAQNTDFTTWDSDGNVDTTGSCRILSLDSNNQKYTLYKDIQLTNNSNNVSIIAENLKYDGQTMQLYSGTGDTVYIQQNDMEITGTGFSASGISNSFNFTGTVNGTITSGDTN